MPNKQKHRGRHPGDEKLFGPKALPDLRAAVRDYAWLVSRGYADNSTLKIVGDRYRLKQRQRLAVQRSACSDAALAGRAQSEVAPANLRGKPLEIDGYNLLITVEVALSGGYLFAGRDGCLRDIASIHGSYRKVEETLPAIQMIGEALAGLQPAGVQWWFDAPVSNSGRLKTVLLEMAADRQWNWEVELDNNPDRLLAVSEGVVASSDSWVIDQAGSWVNLAGWIVRERVKDAVVLDLYG